MMTSSANGSMAVYGAVGRGTAGCRRWRPCTRAFACDNSFLKDVTYWDAFYKKKKLQGGGGNPCFDWFEASDDDVHAHLAALLAHVLGARVLHLGCGTSSWCERLEGGFGPTARHPARVVHLDASLEAVRAVASRLPAAARAGRVLCADARELPFDAGSFDLVVDKGALDVFLACGDGASAAAMVAEVARVLRPPTSAAAGAPRSARGPISYAISPWSEGGVYAMVSNDPPELRAQGFEAAAAEATSGGQPLPTGVRWALRSRDVSTPGAQYEAFLHTATLKHVT